ncbi:MAG: phosphotransferase [Bacillota bacterium]
MDFKPSLLKKILHKYNLSFKNIEDVATGKFNQTFIVEVKDNGHEFELNSGKLVLRIAPSDDAGFVFYEKKMMAREPEIHQIIARKTSIPIPEIYVYDRDRDIINRDYLLMEFIPGTPMSEVQLSLLQKEKIMRSTGKYLKELHENCQNNIFGYPENAEIELTSDWISAFKMMWDKMINDLSNCGIYNQKQANKARKALQINLDKFRKIESASLLHMDIWSQNILIDNEASITGIVDWDRGLWGDPEIEYAVLDYCGFNNPSFWQGYGTKPENSKAKSIRMKFYHLYEVQKYPVIWTNRDPSPERTKQYKKYCLEEIDKLL